MLYMFQLGHDTTKVTKNICRVKSERVVEHRTVTSWFKKFCSSCKNLDNQAKPSRPKTVDFEAVLQAMESNMASSTWRVSGELSISQYSVFITFTTSAKAFRAAELYLTYYQNIVELLIHPCICKHMMHNKNSYNGNKGRKEGCH